MKGKEKPENSREELPPTHAHEGGLSGVTARDDAQDILMDKAIGVTTDPSISTETILRTMEQAAHAGQHPPLKAGKSVRSLEVGQ